jgi:hypothetical protein
MTVKLRVKTAGKNLPIYLLVGLSNIHNIAGQGPQQCLLIIMHNI